MRKRDRWPLIVCIVILLAIIFLEPSYGWKAREFLSPKLSGEADGKNLMAENEALKAELAKLTGIA